VLALLACQRLLVDRPPAESFPAAGERLGAFRIVMQLGRGAHGRVFLATQPMLADRPIVLKLGPRTGDQHPPLSRLPHTNIVPLNSVHDFPERGLRGLCLPYFGGATLAELLHGLRELPPGERTGEDLVKLLGPPPPAGARARQFLARATYIKAVCWIGA